MAEDNIRRRKRFNNRIDKYTFIFNTYEIRKLKQTISALCDPKFNPEGVARIDVDKTGVKFTVWNVESRLLGNLSLVHDGNMFYRDWVLSRVFSPRILDLKRVLELLMLVQHNFDSLDIYHVVESNELNFQFEHHRDTSFHVELLPLSPEFPRFPVITLSCCAYGANIPLEDLREMTPSMSAEEKTQNVSLEMTENYMTIAIGKKAWGYVGSKLDGYTAEGDFSQCFQWPHSELLSKASRMSTRVSLLCCVDDQPDAIVFRFSITQKWRLTFIRLPDFKQNPSYSFSFHVRPITPLKKALAILANSTVSQPPGVGMIHVTDSCCQIVVRNSKTGVIGLVDLLATGLINYRFKTGLNWNMVDVREMARNLVRFDDDDFVDVGRAEGSNEITFKTARAGAFAAELLLMDAGDFQEWTNNISIAWEAAIQSSDVKEMVPLMMTNNIPQPVSLEVEKSCAKLSINGKAWDCVYIDEPPEEKRLHVQFAWGHPETLEQASDLADSIGICYLNHPSRSLMFRVKLEETGYLAYIIGTCSCALN